MHSLETLFKRFVPNFDRSIKGATEEEIAEFEEMSGCIIPDFYNWFLLRMGSDMGELSFPTIDFSVSKLIQCYRDGIAKPDARYLMIGYESKDRFSNIYYDLSTINNGDAQVLRHDPDQDEVEDDYISETFLEYHAWAIVFEYGIEKSPEICKGLFIDDDKSDVLLKLIPVMNDLNFDVPIQTGKYNGIYIGKKASLITHCPPNEEVGCHGFFLGGISKEELRRILYEIERTTSLEIEVDENDPRRLNTL